MSDKNIFEEATRQGLRYETSKGSLSVEDLWNLPLTSNIAAKPNLDDIAKVLYKNLKDTSNEVSFVTPAVKSNYAQQLKFDIVKHIIDVLVAERNAKAEATARREKKQELLALIAQKETEHLSGQSLEELRKLADSL